MHTIALAGSRGRLTLTAVESVIAKDRRDPIRSVVLSGRLPADATPQQQYAAVVRMSDVVQEQNNGAEPRIVVSYGGVGTTVFQLLREDYRQQRRRERPAAITTLSASNDGYARHYTPTLLAANLYREWENDRITFAPGLDKLRGQMAAFVPVETAAGNLGFGNEDMSDYDDAVVSLMFACAVKGYGVPRFIDGLGHIWPSRLIARAKIGTGADDAPQGTYRIEGAG